MRISRLLALGICVFPTLCYAQSQISRCARAGLSLATWDAKTKTISVLFGQPLAETNVKWGVYDLTEARTVPISKADYERPDQYSMPLSASLRLGRTLSDKHAYLLSAANLHFSGCPVAQTPSTVMVNATHKQPSFFALSSSQGRADSDLYLSGLINGAEGARASYTADIKLQMPVILQAASFGKSRPYRPEIDFVPSLDFKGSTNPKADGNSVLIGAGLWFLMPVHTFVSGVIAKPGFSLEADRRFGDINNLFNLKGDFVLPSFGSHLQFVPLPWVGLEVGSNAKAPQRGLYQGAIVRPTVGLHVYINLFGKNMSSRLAFVESDYVRRWPLESEPRFREDNSGKLLLASVGTSPRDYVTTKLEYDFTKYFGVTLQHDYGELPPLFTKVQNEYSVGLVLKAGLQYRPK